MSHIERVDITGFWGDRNLTLDLFPDVTFLIGPNGSGKTTAINIIAAALMGDFATLDRLPFQSISIKLYDPETRRKPIVAVEKKDRADSPFPAIDYSIKDTARGTPLQYSLDELAEARLYREYPGSRLRRSQFYRHAAADVTELLRELAPTSWLSIHRGTSLRTTRDARSSEFTVDQKIEEISNLFVRFFSELERPSTDEAHKFQETIFLNLIYEHETDQLFRAVQDLDLEREQSALIAIFDTFNVPQDNFMQPTSSHFQKLASAMAKWNLKDGVDIESLLLIMNSWRIHAVIKEWNELISKQRNIFHPRDQFLFLLNQMFQRKTIKINEKNELYAESQSGKILTPLDLSSGEKQLLIILGEALLQKGTPWIYIADAPELSLHVEWQAVLVDNVRKMNQSSQIIVATHSPDIVSHFADKVCDMETVLS